MESVMELMQIAVFLTLLGFLDTKTCYFLKKSLPFYWDWNELEPDKNSSKYSAILYKTKLTSVYCSSDEICCGQSCCPDPSVTPSYEYLYDAGEDHSEISTGSYLGMAFAIVFGFFFCMSCCTACCKHNENERENVTVSNHQPVIAYSIDNGAVIIRHEPRDNPASSSSGRGYNSNHESNQPHGFSETYRYSVQDTQETNEVPPYQRGNPSQISEPPPSYEYVMSHNYPIYSDDKSDPAKSTNGHGN